MATYIVKDCDGLSKADLEAFVWSKARKTDFPCVAEAGVDCYADIHWFCEVENAACYLGRQVEYWGSGVNPMEVLNRALRSFDFSDAIDHALAEALDQARSRHNQAQEDDR